MIGAIVFILSLLVLGFCVVSPSATQKFQETAINAWDRMGINRGFKNLMYGLEDSPQASELFQGGSRPSAPLWSYDSNIGTYDPYRSS